MTATVTPEMSSLFMDFARYFDLSVATDEEARANVFRVRYNVYCEEFGYEDASAFQDRMETDAFDAHSIHCLVTHRATGTPAGCVRLVTPAKDELLPMEEHCRDSLDREFFDPFGARREEIAEISRLAVDGRFRRRSGEKASRFGNTATMHFAAREQRTFSLIAVSLFLAASAVADLLRRRDCFAIMEPFLPEILDRTGIVVRRVGDDFEYKGVRAPYFLQIEEAVRAAPEELRLCYEVVRAGFADSISAVAPTPSS